MTPDHVLGFIVGVILVAGWLLLNAWLADSIENPNRRDY